jgi:hypothetical protein
VKLFETWEVILRAKGSCWGQEEMERVTGRNKGVGLILIAGQTSTKVGGLNKQISIRPQLDPYKKNGDRAPSCR